MVDINYLEDERKKLWAKILEQEKTISELKDSFSTSIKTFSDELKKLQIPLPQDVKDAKQSSKEAAFFKNRAKERKEEIDKYFTDVQANLAKMQELTNENIESKKSINAQLKAIEQKEKNLLTIQNNLQDTNTELQPLIANIKSSTTILNEITTLRNSVKEKQTEILDSQKQIENLFELSSKQKAEIAKIRNQITGYIKSVIGVASGIFDVFVSFVVSVYILAERDEILKYFRRLLKVTLKPETFSWVEKYFNDSNVVFFKFIESQFVDAIIVGVLVSIAMKIIGVKYAILLGAFIGLFNMIPYFGAIIAVTISGIITLMTGGVSQTIIMLIVVIILQQIDANIINPKIVGDSLKISPLLVIIAVTIGGAYFGMLGMFLSVPIMAVLKILLNDYIDSKEEI